jgi:hypothetical protein
MMVDMRGMEFEVGDRVAVARRQSSTSWIAIRRVAEIKDGVPWLRDKPDDRARRYGGTSMSILNLDAIDS